MSGTGRQLDEEVHQHGDDAILDQGNGLHRLLMPGNRNAINMGLLGSKSCPLISISVAHIVLKSLM